MVYFDDFVCSLSSYHFCCQWFLVSWCTKCIKHLESLCYMCNLYIKHFETYLFFGLIHDLTLTTTSTKANNDNQVGYEINLLAITLRTWQHHSFLLIRVVTSVVFCCWTQSASRLDMLCMQRCSSAHLWVPVFYSCPHAWVVSCDCLIFGLNSWTHTYWSGQ